MSKEMDPTRLMGLVIILAGVSITIFLFIRYGIIGLFVGLIIFLALIIMYLLWARMVKTKASYDELRKYVIRKKEPRTQTS